VAVPKDLPLFPLADILPPPLPALIQSPGSLSESCPRELRELTWTVLDECRYEYRFIQNLVPYCSRLIERLGEAYLKSGAAEALLRMGELVERVVSVNLPLKSTGAVNGSNADPNEARQKEVLELVGGSPEWQWLAGRAASGEEAGKASSVVDSQEAGAGPAGAGKPAAQNPDLVESKTDTRGGPSSAPSRQVTGNVGVPASFSPFNSEPQPIRPPANLPAHWSGPLRDRCREVLVKAEHHLGQHGTIDNLVFYCQVVIDCLEADQQTVDFCREFGRNAPAEMAWLMARILATYISDEREIDRLAEEITATRQWKRFAGRTASPAIMSAYWQRLHAEQTRAAGVGLPVQTKAEETPIAVEPVVAPSETVAAMPGRAEVRTRNGEAFQDPPPAATPSEVSPSVESKQTRPRPKKKPSLNYTSRVKRTIQVVLTKHPEVRSDHRKIANLMDEEGTAEVPPDWKAGTRLFAEVHKRGDRNRQRLNVYISTVISDMQVRGLLPPGD
jgi:hypothetical protein